MSLQLATLDGVKVENRVSINGRNLGQRLAFNAEGTPAQMRAVYRASGLKGNALSKAVRDAQKAGKDIAWVQFHALTQMAQNGDFIPTMGDMNSKGDKIKLELVKPSEVKPSKSTTQESVKIAFAALLATGMDKESAEKALRLAGVL